MFQKSMLSVLALSLILNTACNGSKSKSNDPAPEAEPTPAPSATPIPELKDGPGTNAADPNAKPEDKPVVEGADKPAPLTPDQYPLVTDLPSGATVRIQSKNLEGHCLDFSGNLELKPCAADAAGQKIVLQKFKDNSYSLTTTDKLCLDINQRNFEAGPFVIKHACHAGSNQQLFLYSGDRSQFVVTLKHSNLCLDQAESVLWQQGCNNNDSQLWLIEAVQ